MSINFKMMMATATATTNNLMWKNVSTISIATVTRNKSHAANPWLN
jgi:hypothetical protein